MRTSRRGNKAQNFVEYTLILGIVGVALFTMQTYFKRGIQSVIKVTADGLGPQGEPFKNEEERKEQEAVNIAVKAHYNYDHKFKYTSNSSQDETIINEGEGKIRREVAGKASFDDDSY